TVAGPWTFRRPLPDGLLIYEQPLTGIDRLCASRDVADNGQISEPPELDCNRELRARENPAGERADSSELSVVVQLLHSDSNRISMPAAIEGSRPNCSDDVARTSVRGLNRSGRTG